MHNHDAHPQDAQNSGSKPEAGNGARPSPLVVELREHAPFSVSAVAIGLIVAGTICVLGFAAGGDTEALVEHTHADTDGDHLTNPAELLFHLFHPAHMLFSAVATTAMFRRYDRRAAKAVVIGLIGAIGVCGISDIVVPHLSLTLLKVEAPWHICILEHPTLALPFAAVGVLVGIAASGGVIRSTLISHALHVFVSTMASIFYMVGPLGIIAWISDIGKVFVFVVLAVMIPCCLSDIVFPLLMSKSGRSRYGQEPHAH